MNHIGHDQILDILFICQSLFCLSYLISTIFQAANVYNGFNAILLGIVFASMVGCSYMYLRKNISKVMYGGVLGATFVLIFLSLQSAVFWGQYSGCESYPKEKFSSLTGNPPMCTNTPAMESICTFSVFMFLSYVAQLVIMIVFKHEILGSNSDSKNNQDAAFHNIPMANLSNPFDSSNHVSNKANGNGNSYGYMPLENLLEAIKPKNSSNTPTAVSEESLYEYSYDLEEEHATIPAHDSPTMRYPIKQ
jgi:hypothetical protein